MLGVVTLQQKMLRTLGALGFLTALISSNSLSLSDWRRRSVDSFGVLSRKPVRCDDRPKILKSRFRVMNMAKKRMLATICA